MDKRQRIPALPRYAFTCRIGTWRRCPERRLHGHQCVWAGVCASIARCQKHGQISMIGSHPRCASESGRWRSGYRSTPLCPITVLFHHAAPWHSSTPSFDRREESTPSWPFPAPLYDYSVRHGRLDRTSVPPTSEDAGGIGSHDDPDIAVRQDATGIGERNPHGNDRGSGYHSSELSAGSAAACVGLDRTDRLEPAPSHWLRLADPL